MFDWSMDDVPESYIIIRRKQTCQNAVVIRDPVKWQGDACVYACGHDARKCKKKNHYKWLTFFVGRGDSSISSVSMPESI